MIKDLETIDKMRARGYLETRPKELPLEFKLAGFRPEPWTVADSLAVVYLMVGGALVFSEIDSGSLLTTAVAAPRAFGRYLFERHWLSIEVVSLLLLIALVGALHLGRAQRGNSDEEEGDLR